MKTRAFAFFIGLLTTINLAGDWLWRGFDGNAWWISLGATPVWLSATVLAAFAISMLLFGLAGKARSLACVTAGVVGVVTLANAAQFYGLIFQGKIAAGFPLPFSLVVCAGLLAVARMAWLQRQGVPESVSWWHGAMGGTALLAAYPLALMVFFGNTDYRRPADVAVVFGARVYKDGHLSDALRDRIATACALYRDGLVKRIALSGGPGDGPITEAAAMRNYALRHGVRGEDLFIDNAGVNTEATVRDTAPLLRQWKARRILAVSHFYHLPRIKLAYERAGLDVCTVPARQERLLGQIPFNMVREVAAFWTYYFRDRTRA